MASVTLLGRKNYEKKRKYLVSKKLVENKKNANQENHLSSEEPIAVLPNIFGASEKAPVSYEKAMNILYDNTKHS